MIYNNQNFSNKKKVFDNIGYRNFKCVTYNHNFIIQIL